MRPALVTFLLLVAALLVGEAAAPPRDDGQWTMPGKDFAATRYSGLREITPANVARLRPRWSFSTGVLGGHEGQPLVVNNTMYVVTPFPNVLYAFDLTREGYPLKWKYRPDVNPTSVGIACCDAINRGAFYADGRIVYNLLDGHTVAVDAATGRELWKTQIADLGQGETTPMAPFVVKGKVIVGPSGGEFGIHGWVKALDLGTGRLAWTAYSEGPDADVLARPGTFKPFYDHGTDLALTSWPADAWQRAGVPVWGWLSYDPELDLLYYGTGNAAPYTPVRWAQRLDLATGRPVVDTAKLTGASRGNIKDICPSLEGGKSPVSAASYSPRTGLFYVSTNNLCMDYQATQVTRIAGTPYIGASTPYHAGPGGHMGAFIAWDASVGRRAWEIREPYPVWSGSVVTAGDVVFYGTLDGWFKAADARSGRVLWKFKVGSGVVGCPITYTGPDGRQYVAVYAGIGGGLVPFFRGVRSDDPADVRPPADLAPDLAPHTSQGGVGWVFRLP